MTEPRYTAHARRKVAERGITPEMVSATIAASGRRTVGRTAVEYDGIIDDRPIRVVVVKDSDPPLVITAHWIDR